MLLGKAAGYLSCLLLRPSLLTLLLPDRIGAHRGGGQSFGLEQQVLVQRALGHADIRSSGVYTQTPREAVENALSEIDRPQRRVTRAALRRGYEGRAA